MENLDSLKIASNMLRSQREKLNLSIKEISSELRLEESIIRDIEKANFNKFNSYLFLKGYLKNYADFLEIKINLPDNKERKKPKVKKVKNKVNKNNYIKTILALLFFILIIIFLTKDYKKNSEIIIENKITVIPNQKDDNLRNENSIEKVLSKEKIDSIIIPYNQSIAPLSKEVDNKLEATLDDSKEKVSKTSGSNTKEKPLEITQKGVLVIEYSDDSWTEIINSNEDIVFFDLVKGGKTLEIKILAPFEILLGDATVVNIKYNNKVVKVPYFNPDNNVGKIKINN